MTSFSQGFVSLFLLCICTWLASPICYLKLRGSQFQDIIDDTGVTSRLYKGHAAHSLSLLSGYRRGVILQDLCRKELAKMNPNSKIQAGTHGTCCNGQRRAEHQSENDGRIDERGFECKSSLIKWKKDQKCWYVSFSRIKLPLAGIREQAPFDELYLIILSPDHVYIVKHDLNSFVTTAGKATSESGHHIWVRGTAKQECWKTAWKQILEKLLGGESGCSLIAQVDLSNPGVQSWLSQSLRRGATLQDAAYLGIPFSSMNSALRGLRVEKIGLKIDQMLNPSCVFSRECSTVDWIRNGIGVEVKHGQMLFHKDNHH